METRNNPWVALFRWTALVLLVVVGAELAIILWNAMATPAGEGGPQGRDGNESLQVSPLPDPDSFSDLIERSLFSWNRKPRSPEGSNEKTEEGEVESTWQLAGLVDTGRSTYAIFRESDGQRRLRLEKGDELDGWTIESLDTMQVVLTKDGERETYRLSVTDQQRVVEPEETEPVETKREEPEPDSGAPDSSTDGKPAQEEGPQ